jgi:hypothetical protein
MNPEKSTNITLDYIQKLYGNMQAAGKYSNQLSFINTLLTALLFAFSIGIVDIKNNFSVSGLSFELQMTKQILLLITSFLISATFMFASGMGAHSGLLREQIIRLYKEIGFNDLSFLSTPASVLEYPSIVGHTVGFMDRLSSEKPSPGYFFYRFFFILVLIAMPLAIQAISILIQWSLSNGISIFVVASTFVIIWNLYETYVYFQTQYKRVPRI